MRIVSGRSGAASNPAKDTFSGVVWQDGVITDLPNLKVNNVTFTPGGRTYWHFHDQGQLLQVFVGQGYVAGADGVPHLIKEGDSIYIEPGERHWHGGTQVSYCGHTAVTLGSTTWLEEVSEEEYAAAAVHTGIGS
jgi:quercetin dioxygenase-like cupin family protein